MRRLLLIVLVLLNTGAAAAAGGASFSFIALGDMPYFTPTDFGRFERLIARINREKPAFSIHVGDIKGGSTPCTDAAFQEVRQRFDLFDQALFYTPGDNDWTDCHRKKAGGYDPRERLTNLRRVFFAQPRSFGRYPLPYQRQADQGVHRQMAENGTWTHAGVRFATVHVVGSNNGNQRKHAGAVEEFKPRDNANKDWIAAVGKMARREGAKALVYAFHADPWYKGGGSGFTRTLKALAKAAKKFDGPILIINGDIHTYRVDQPLDGKKGKKRENVTRLRVMGSPDLRAVKVTVTPGAAEPFRFDVLDPGVD